MVDVVGRQMDDEAPAKPRLRGRLHQVAFFVSVPAGVALIAAASRADARIVAAVFAVSLSGLYGTSALYHRHDWSPAARRIARRFDHAMIFVLIAGTYTPISWLGLSPAWAVTLLALAWTGAIVGATLKFVRLEGFRRMGYALYLVLGWLVVISGPQLTRTLTPGELGLLLAGGLLYTIGSILFATQRPNPLPRVFGYHEVWHSFVVAAGLCHYLAIYALVR